MYRVHEAPGREKLVALKDYLATFDLEFALGQVIKPATFNAIITRFGDREGKQEIMEQVLRTQMQARLLARRLGHFGLALATYALPRRSGAMPTRRPPRADPLLPARRGRADRP